MSKNTTGGQNQGFYTIRTSNNTHSPIQVNSGGQINVDLVNNMEFQNLVTMVKMIHERVEKLEKAEKDLLKRVQKAVRLRQILDSEAPETVENR